MTLDELLINLDGLSDEEAEERGWQEYCDVYLNRGKIGVLQLHKGDEVVFHGEERYEHAFRTSQDRIRSPYSKTKVARERIERLRWIGAVIQGKVPGTQCWAVTSLSYRTGRDRLYVVVANKYVVRLAARDAGGWKFVTAYTATKQDIERYTQRGTLMWTVPAETAEQSAETGPEKGKAP